MPKRRLTITSEQRVRDQLEWLDLQMLSASIYQNERLERRLASESKRLKRLLDDEDGGDLVRR